MGKINDLVKQVHYNAVVKGWWDDGRTFGELIALCHSELSEALEDAREGRSFNQMHYDNGKPCGIPSELADTVIRIMDMCGAYGIDLEKAINEKIEYNQTRPVRHGKVF